MNQIQKLEHWLQTYIPDCRVKLDPPDNPEGPWFLDIESHGHSLVVEWRPNRGFGVTAGSKVTYGEGPHEVYPDLESAIRRIISLLLLGRNTPPR
jgi:hypothetical protein